MFLQVMIYNGQLDIIIAVPLTEAWLQTVQWKGLPEYKNASRFVWKINPSDTEVAGWVRQVQNFYQVSAETLTRFLCIIAMGPPKGVREFLMSPPCLESQVCQFDPTFLYLLFCFSA